MNSCKKCEDCKEKVPTWSSNPQQKAQMELDMKVIAHIKRIVESHNGEVTKIDLATRTIETYVPEAEEVACCEEVLEIMHDLGAVDW